MKKPIILGVSGLFIGYFIYLMIYLFSRGPVDSSLGGWIPVATGIILFFIGRQYYSRPQAASTATPVSTTATSTAAPTEKKPLNMIVFTIFALIAGVTLVIVAFGPILRLLFIPGAIPVSALSPTPFVATTSIQAVIPASESSPTPFIPTISIPYCNDSKKGGLISGNSYLCMVSDEGDFIGQGENWLLTANDATFSTMFWWDDGGGGSITVKGKTEWGLDFRAPQQTVLKPGIYENSVRAMSALRTPKNGLDISGMGHGCNEVTGKFEVLEIVRGTNNDLTSFAANFEQHCEGKTPALVGYIRINSKIP